MTRLYLSTTAALSLRRSGKFYGLDGLRGLSILLVIACHWKDAEFDANRTYEFGSLMDGLLGVRIFFVISGFLITRIICEELDHPGGFSFKRFYLKRLFKLAPVLYLYLLALTALTFIAGMPPKPWDFFRAATFTTFHTSYVTEYLSHTWSLSIEEFFYLTWVPVIALARTRGARFAYIAACLVGAPLARGFNAAKVNPKYSAYFDWVPFDMIPVVNYMDTIALGSLLALFYVPISGRLRALSVAKRQVVKWSAAFGIFLPNLILGDWLPPVMVTLGLSLQALAITIFVATAICAESAKEN